MDKEIITTVKSAEDEALMIVAQAKEQAQKILEQSNESSKQIIAKENLTAIEDGKRLIEASKQKAVEIVVEAQKKAEIISKEIAGKANANLKLVVDELIKKVMESWR